MASSETHSQKGGKRRRKDSKQLFPGNFNIRTNKLIELSRSNSCPFPRRGSETSLMSNDGTLSQSSNSGVSNREKYRQKRLDQRAKVTPMKIDASECTASAKAIYEQLLDEKSALEAFDILLASLRDYFSSLHIAEDCIESSVRIFIRNHHLLVSARELADKYLTKSRGAPLNQKLNEYKLQTLLHIFALLPGTEINLEIKETELNEIISIIRMISASGDTGIMQSFLNEDILETFLNFIPRHLTRLYEELYQPLPPELSVYACNESEDAEFDITLLNSPNRKFVPTVSEEVIPNPKPLRKTSSFLGGGDRHHKMITVPSSGAKRLKLKDVKKEQAKKEKGGRARKSLTFEAQTKHKTPIKKRSIPVDEAVEEAVDSTKSSPRTPKRTKQGRTIVQDTPIHKQRPPSEYRQEKFKRMSTNGVRQIVQETPEKLLEMAGTRKSPRRQASTRLSSASAPIALSQLSEEENVEAVEEPGPATVAIPVESTVSSPLKSDRRRLLLKNFLSEYKSPKKRIRKAVRALLESPCTKSNSQQDRGNGMAFSFAPIL